MILRRNLMHMFVGLVITAIYAIFGKWPSFSFLFFIFVAGMFMQMIIASGRKIPIIENFLDAFETEEETENWRGLGAQTLVLGSLITIFFFDYKVVIPALLVLTISDALSAIAGTYIDSTVILEDRTVFGTTAFFVSALVILAFFVPVPIALMIALAVSIVELIPLPDDNVWIPLATAFLLSVAMPFL